MYYDYYLYYLSYFSSLYNGYPLIIRVTVVMVTILIAITVFGFIRLLIMGYKINRRDKRRAAAQSHFGDKLTFIMKSKTLYDIEEVKELLQYDVKRTKNWKSDILTDIVLSVKNSVYKQGELNEINYRNCLEALRLMGFWEKRIRTSGLDKRREALQIVGQMDNGVNSGILSKSTFHKNKYLRKTARDLHTSQDNYNPFKFMEENFDEAFTQLDKLRLHSTLVKRSRENKLPNLLRWINNSKNPSYIVFILREVAFFNQQEAAPTLMTMLDRNENRDIRAQIILTIGALGYKEAIPNLKERFALESVSVREAIITTMGKIQESDVLSFLVQTYESTDDANLKFSIARAIKKYDVEGDRTLRLLQKEALTNDKSREGTLLEQVISENTVLSV